MELIVKKLTPDILEDFLNFFDNIAFTDNPDWAGCYCHHYHFPGTMEQWRETTNEQNRNATIQLIIDKKMTGPFYGTVKLKTLFWVPKQFGQVWSFRGSSFHFPPTKNLYSYFPGGSTTALFHTPLSLFFMGWVLGFHLLKSPIKMTSLASLDSNENVTLRRLIFCFDLIFAI